MAPTIPVTLSRLGVVLSQNWAVYGAPVRMPCLRSEVTAKIHTTQSVSSSRRLRFADQEDSRKNKRVESEPKVSQNKRNQESFKKKFERPADSLWWSRMPTDDVWFLSHYPTKRYSLRQSIEMHRQFAVPEMLDNMSGLVETKFTNSYNNTVLLPHLFDTGIKRNIVAFSKNEEDIMTALSMGASLAGGPELIQQIQTDEVFLEEDTDFLIATLDVLQELVAIKDKLKDFPSKGKRTTGMPMEDMMALYTNGITYKTFRLPKTDGADSSIARLRVPIGRLDMPIEHLEENWMTLIETLSEHRAANLGPLITEAKVSCHPSREHFPLIEEQMVQTKNAQKLPAEGKTDELEDE